METKEERRAILEGAIGGAVLGQLDDILTAGNAGANAEAVIGMTLTVVEDNYHLVPKVKIAVDDELVDEPAPENAIQVSLAQYWNEVNS